ncbi:MAG TPA: serine/threonine protein kinase [Isosphaeraceae bacterium]|nr:serine/threonine protein kinase [Isosphaeraceae bacterium]
MAGDLTQVQGDDERFRARDLSLQRQQPPTQVPGYDPVEFLGAGAYGEVWVARDRNTGRLVAIKFYAHRGGLDWSLLSREVDKLAILFSDRHVVQLIEVGWNADPPYYVMEYLGEGSLEDRLGKGPMSVAEAVMVFREVAVALVHAHGKGILHCDLKPANVLLDQDMKPRLADFGQSRLSHEQTPALGTLFYMAPEQADLKAAPDARWDVYALGALLYCMLAGHPPYRSSKTADSLNQPSGSLEHRLTQYRKQIEAAPRPTEHRNAPGIDRSLAEIVDRCLAVSPSHRYPNAQAVLEALKARDTRKARQPLLLFGAIGPALLLSLVSLLAFNGFHLAVEELTTSLAHSARVGNEFASEVFADHIGMSIDRRWRILEHEADDPEFRDLVRTAAGKSRQSPERKRLQLKIDALRGEHLEIPSVAWVVVGADGTILARSPLDDSTIDHNVAQRDFFHGQGGTRAENSKAAPITDVHRSVIHHSRATGDSRTLAFSVPIWSGEPDDPKRRVVGVLLSSVEVGDFADFKPPDEAGKDLVPVLIDTNVDDDGKRGAVLFHPYFAQLRKRFPNRNLPDVHVEPSGVLPWNPDYRDPVGRLNVDYSGRWFAASEPVVVEGRRDSARNTGWVVIVEESYDSVIGPVLKLKQKLVWRGALTLVVIILMLTALWGSVIGVLNRPSRFRLSSLWKRGGRGSETLSGHSAHSGTGQTGPGKPSPRAPDPASPPRVPDAADPTRLQVAPGQADKPGAS